MSDLVGTPEDRFSRVTAHIAQWKMLFCDKMQLNMRAMHCMTAYCCEMIKASQQLLKLNV